MSRQSVRRTYFRATDGFVKNPMYWDYGRNEKCPCGSGKKFKRCCRPEIPMYVPEDAAADYQESMDAMRIERGFKQAG